MDINKRKEKKRRFLSAIYKVHYNKEQHTYTHKHTRARARSHIQTHTHTLTHTHTRVHTQTNKHTHKHTHIHTHTHIHKQLNTQKGHIQTLKKTLNTSGINYVGISKFTTTCMYSYYILSVIVFHFCCSHIFLYDLF